MKFHKWFTPNFSTTWANFQPLSQWFKWWALLQTCLCKLSLCIYRASIFKRPLYMESIPRLYSCCRPTCPNYFLLIYFWVCTTRLLDLQVQITGYCTGSWVVRMWWHPLIGVDLYVIGKVVVLQESPLYLCAVVKVKMNSTLHKPTMLRTGKRTLPVFFTARSQDMLDGRLWWRALTTKYFPPSRFVVWENATFSL